MMFQNLYPNKLIRSVYELDWEELSRTYGGVIFDIDNTLVPHGAAADEAAIQLFARIHDLGMKTMLVSNNGEARDILTFRSVALRIFSAARRSYILCFLPASPRILQLNDCIVIQQVEGIGRRRNRCCLFLFCQFGIQPHHLNRDKRRHLNHRNYAKRIRYDVTAERHARPLCQG